MPLTIPPITIHSRIAGEPGEVRPWSVDELAIRTLGNERGKGVKVGSIDTGVDLKHAENGWLRHSFREGRDFTNSRFSFWDSHGHGTHTCATMTGDERTNGGPGLAPKAELYVAKGLGDDGSGSDESIADAALWLRFDKRCHIINLSLGGPQKSPIIIKALHQVIADGGLVVCAAGNDGDFATSWPANDDQMISVAAVDLDHRPASFSSPSSVDVAAPGVRILSCYRGGGFAVLDGTSMAAPWVSGWLAIYLGDLIRANKPLPKQSDIFDLILGWTEDVGSPGRDTKTGPGMVSPTKYRKAEPPKQDEGINLGFCKIRVPARQGDWFSVGS